MILSTYVPKKIAVFVFPFGGVCRSLLITVECEAGMASKHTLISRRHCVRPDTVTCFLSSVDFNGYFFEFIRINSSKTKDLLHIILNTFCLVLVISHYSVAVILTPIGSCLTEFFSSRIELQNSNARQCSLTTFVDDFHWIYSIFLCCYKYSFAILHRDSTLTHHCRTRL